MENCGDWSAGATGVTYHDYYDGQRIIDTGKGSDDVVKQHPSSPRLRRASVWGMTYIDQLVRVRDGSNGHRDGKSFSERAFENSVVSPDNPRITRRR